MIDPTPNPYCHYCNGTGTVYQYVPYGDTEVREYIGCECLTDEPDPVHDDEPVDDDESELDNNG